MSQPRYGSLGFDDLVAGQRLHPSILKTNITHSKMTHAGKTIGIAAGLAEELVGLFWNHRDFPVQQTIQKKGGVIWPGVVHTDRTVWWID